MNANELHVHQSFQGAVLWGWLKRFPLQFHFIHGLVTTLAVPPRVTQARRIGRTFREAQRLCVLAAV